MIKTETRDPRDIQDFGDYVQTNLGLVKDRTEPSVYLRLKPDYLPQRLFEKTTFENPSDLYKYFDDARVIEPDGILRPAGDTTFFTTAGVQHIETIIRESGTLTKDLFMIAQPVIRSQFMDKVKDGTSTSFVNFSVEYPYATRSEFTGLTSELIQLILAQGINPQRLKLQLENSSDKWGRRAFDNSFITVYLDDIELGECVYIHNYPVSENEHVPIADVSFGVERVNWAINKDKPYFPGFDRFYSIDGDRNKIASIIDCIRTSVLIAGEGVKPAHFDPGYRLRQLLKRFVSMSSGLSVDASEIVRVSYDYWKKWGFKPTISEDKIGEIVKSEIERSYNVLVLSVLEKNGGPKISLNVNQSTHDFLKDVDLLPKNIKKQVYRTIEEMK